MITLYLGGFEKIGGIEKFARDLMVKLADEFPERQLCYWGRDESELPLVREIRESGCSITRTPLRSGCRWHLPDYLLLSRSLRALRQSSLVIFKKSPPVAILRFLRKYCLRHNPNCKFICITPYRPRELWVASSQVETHLGLYDAILVQSSQWKEDLRDLGYRGKISAIPYFPPSLSDITPLPYCTNNGVVKLGFLGRLEDQKNIPMLLEVYRRLQDEYPGQYELHLFGDGSLRDWLLAEINTRSDQEIHYHGSVPSLQVAAAIDSCDIFLITSKTEGQCLVALEVLARGRPLVSAPVGALPDILADARLGSLADAGDASHFAQAVHQLAAKIHSGQSDASCVRAAYESHYSGEVILQGYLAIFRGLLEESA